MGPDRNGRGRRTAPVVVGGVGGSGTRVLAEILRDVGYFLGPDLNEASDNVWFTILFKRQTIGGRPRLVPPAEAARRLDLFERIMLGTGRPSAAEAAKILGLASITAAIGHDRLGSRRGPWALRIARNMIRARPPELAGSVGWGFKEPNAHLYQAAMAKRWPDMRFILMVRHGLDMAFSGNQAQVLTFGGLYGVKARELSDLTPPRSLDYWIRANREAIATGRRLFGDRFLVVGYEAICLEPRPEIERVLRFLGREVGPEKLDALCRLPRPPRSIGRYREQSLAAFTPAQLAAVEELGFPVERV